MDAGAVVATLVPADPDEVPAGTPADPDEVPATQGNAANWGPTTEILNGAMMGTLPQAEGWISSHLPQGMMPSGEQIQADRDAYAQQHPVISGITNVTGQAIPYMMGGEALGGAGLLARAAGMGATGAGLNAGAAEIKGEDPSAAALAGALAGAGGEVGASALTGAAGKLADAVVNRGVNVPSSSSLKSLTNSQYDALQQTPTFAGTLAEGKQLGQDVLDQLGGKWFNAPGVEKVFNDLTNPPGNASHLTAGGLEAGRQRLNAIIRNSPGTDDAAAAAVGKQGIDNYLQGRAASDPAIQQFLDDAQAARGNYRAYKASDIVTRNVDRATGQASTNLSDNSNQLISKRANAILQQPKLSGGMSPDELSALQDLRSGSPIRNTLQSLGAATGHTGIGLAVAVPELAGRLLEGGITPKDAAVAAGAMGLGYGAHRLANALAERQGRGVAQLIRSNSPSFRDAVASGASTAPVNVGPTVDAARKLASAFAAGGATPLLQQGMTNAPQ